MQYSVFTLGSLATLAQALHEANRCAGKIKLGAQLIFQKPLKTEVQWRLLVCEDEKRRRRGFRQALSSNDNSVSSASVNGR